MRDNLLENRPIGIIRPLLIFGFFVSYLAFTGSISTAGPKIDEDAKRFSTLLAPVPPAESAQTDVFGNSKKLIPILEALEKSARSNGPAPDSLISKGIEFRSDIGRWESMMLTHSLLKNWREAQSLGLFSDTGKFSFRIQNGRGAGSNAVFEHVVPPEVYPPASNQIANLRLIPEGQKRKEGAPLTVRESAFRDQLVKMIDERNAHNYQRAYAEKRAREEKQSFSGNGSALRDRGPTNAMGETEAEQERLWKEEVEQAGKEVVAQMPKIRVRGKMEATPSRKTQERWRVRVYVENLSAHPTEVNAQVWLLGTTYKKRELYIMSKSDHSLKLRPGEGRMLDLYTNSEGSYKGKADDLDGLSKEDRSRSRVRYRGFSISVEHAKGVAAFAGSDQRLSGFADPGNDQSPLWSMPRF